MLSAAGPNRTYLCSGTIDAQRKFSDFVAFSGGDELGKFLKWQSYPETLQAAGVSWKVSGDGSWSRRYTGHLEDGRNSITG